MREAANALREKKRWILTPKENTYDYLTRSLATMLTCVINGNWDSLERIKYAELAHPHLWRSRLLHMFGLIFEATFPILAFLIVEHFHPLPAPVDSYFIVGSLAWILIMIFGSLDPNFNDKIGDIEELSNLLRGGGSTDNQS